MIYTVTVTVEQFYKMAVVDTGFTRRKKHGGYFENENVMSACGRVATGAVNAKKIFHLFFCVWQILPKNGFSVSAENIKTVSVAKRKKLDPCTYR